MVCIMCGKKFDGGYSVEGHDVCDECGKTYSLEQIYDTIDKNTIKNEDATQASMVNGGKIDAFGDVPNFNYNDWYTQLFELKDYE